MLIIFSVCVCFVFVCGFFGGFLFIFYNSCVCLCMCMYDLVVEFSKVKFVDDSMVKSTSCSC